MGGRHCNNDKNPALLGMWGCCLFLPDVLGAMMQVYLISIFRVVCAVLLFCAAGGVGHAKNLAPILVDDTARGPAHVGGEGSQSAPQSTQTGAEDDSKDVSVAEPVVRIRPQARDDIVPHTRWAHRPEALIWTRGAMSALKTHGRPLTNMIPKDIATWCPGYISADAAGRARFWTGFLSALAKYESTYRPEAVGGGGKWYGLLQILPATARGYKCHVGTGAALKNGAANLSCAIRIMAVTVPRDGVISGHDRKWRGVAADWGPMRSAAKRKDMAGWLRQQTYCTKLSSLRPKLRPEGIGH